MLNPQSTNTFIIDSSSRIHCVILLINLLYFSFSDIEDKSSSPDRWIAAQIIFATRLKSPFIFAKEISISIFWFFELNFGSRSSDQFFQISSALISIMCFCFDWSSLVKCESGWRWKEDDDSGCVAPVLSIRGFFAMPRGCAYI